jgi:hypothetical protein
MKKIILIVVGIAFLTTGACTCKRQMIDWNEKRYTVEGSWIHTFHDNPRMLQIKILNRTHFVWVTYERDTGLPLLMGGGTYTFDGITYRERVEFGSSGSPQELIGKEQVFTPRFAGDQ